MAFTKEQIYNLALSALLLSEEVTNIASQKSNNISILNRFYDIAFQSSLQDMDLDALSTPITLELIEALPSDHLFTYAYKYPSNCVFLRRLENGVRVDRRSTHITKRVGMYEGQKAIFTDQFQAVAECIPKDIPLDALNPMAIMTVSYKLAFLSAPLVVGKGAKKLRDSLRGDYALAKHEAQETDSRENFNYDADYERSEFVEERIS